jgi:hypothetical protein
MVVRLCFFGFSFPVTPFVFCHLFSSLPSFRLHASDAHHRGPLEPAGVEGHAMDDVEIIPGKGEIENVGSRHADGGGNSRHKEACVRCNYCGKY